jgi:hypothetical protein
MSCHPKSTYSFKAILIRAPVAFFAEIKNIIRNFSGLVSHGLVLLRFCSSPGWVLLLLFVLSVPQCTVVIFIFSKGGDH